MLLLLHEGFTFRIKGRLRAYVEAGVLKVDSKWIRWEDMMYALAYSLNRISFCMYCERTLKKSNRTIDHIFPKDYGGVSISNNLIPCCFNCNTTKSNLNMEEFVDFNRRKTDEQKDNFRSQIIREKEKIRYTKGFVLPESWISYRDIKELKVRDYYLNNPIEHSKIEENLEYIEKYNHLKRPIIVDRNLWIIDGYKWYLAAKEKQIDKVPIIYLENVELVNL